MTVDLSVISLLERPSLPAMIHALPAPAFTLWRSCGGPAYDATRPQRHAPTAGRASTSSSNTTES